MEARAGRRTQAERREAAEAALLEAAAELVAERGVDRATLAGIGERAGTSRGLATHHFGSKEALVARLAERVQRASFVRVEEAVAAAPPQTSGLDLLRVALRRYLELFAVPGPLDRALVVMWGETFPSGTPVRGLRDADRRGADGWAEGVRRGQADGSVRTDLDAELAGELLLAMTRGAAALLLTDADRLGADRVVEATAALLASALAAAPTGP